MPTIQLSEAAVACIERELQSDDMWLTHITPCLEAELALEIWRCLDEEPQDSHWNSLLLLTFLFLLEASED
jgi:hypothetical protein